ncbi:MAG TPA: amidohydrolase [Bacteroidales bacterium]|nr:amidohydrolase [Bacteroidales bacterium]
MASQFRVSLVQSDISWENRAENLSRYEKRLRRLRGKTDLAILPETFTTGFSMQVEALADEMEGETIRTVRRWAKDFGFAITGSFIAKEGGRNYNRGFFVTPEGACHIADKRHLFRMGGEDDFYSAGESRETISYLGWKIRLLICYDLRFPVWSRNIDNGYDLLLVCANWPAPRRHVWSSLLTARALENMSYVCGVNRVGTDGEGLSYSGDSCLIDAYGNALTTMQPDLVQVETVDIDLESLHRFRDKFPAWMDADRFQLIEEG